MEAKKKIINGVSPLNISVEAYNLPLCFLPQQSEQTLSIIDREINRNLLVLD